MEVRARGNWGGAISLLVFAALFGALWAVSDTPEIALVVLPLIAIAVRYARIKVSTDGDRLVVRNIWRTYNLDRAEITKFWIEDSLGGKAGRTRTVVADLGDRRRRRLTATGRGYRMFPPFWARTAVRTEADDVCDQLNAWLR